MLEKDTVEDGLVKSVASAGASATASVLAEPAISQRATDFIPQTDLIRAGTPMWCCNASVRGKGRIVARPHLDIPATARTRFHNGQVVLTAYSRGQPRERADG